MYDPHLGGTLCTELNGHISCNLFVYIYMMTNELFKDLIEPLKF